MYLFSPPPFLSHFSLLILLPFLLPLSFSPPPPPTFLILFAPLTSTFLHQHCVLPPAHSVCFFFRSKQIFFLNSFVYPPAPLPFFLYSFVCIFSNFHLPSPPPPPPFYFSFSTNLEKSLGELEFRIKA